MTRYYFRKDIEGYVDANNEEEAITKAIKGIKKFVATLKDVDCIWEI